MRTASRRAASALVAAVTLCAQGAHGQGNTGFPAGEGRTHVAFSYAWDAASDDKLGGSSTSLPGDLVRRSASVSVAYGFTDRLDAWISGGYGWSEPEGAPAVPDESGLADSALESGYDLRLGAPDDEVPLHLTVGQEVAPHLHLSAFYSRVESLGGATFRIGLVRSF